MRGRSEMKLPRRNFLHLAARQRSRPDAENFGGGVSFPNPPLPSHHSITSSAQVEAMFSTAAGYKLISPLPVALVEGRQIGSRQRLVFPPKTRTLPEHLRAKHPSRRHRQFPARASRSLRRRAALSIRMNAPISLKPSESEMKSSIWAIDNALPEPCGANAFGAPSKKNSIGTCR